jgi:hypothetical protein
MISDYNIPAVGMKTLKVYREMDEYREPIEEISVKEGVVVMIEKRRGGFGACFM